VGAGKFFHTVVIMGLGAAGACGRGEQDAAELEAPTGGAGSVDPFTSLAGFAGASEPEGVFWPSECEYRSQYHCESYHPLQGCVCDESLPRGPQDCGGETRISCDRLCAPGEACGLTGIEDYIDCHCNPDAPAGPEDCEGPGQFACEFYDPAFRDCVCNPDRPATPEDCDKPEDYFCNWQQPNTDVFYDCACLAGTLPEVCQEQACPYTCQSTEPRFGCQCECGIIV
jgi:hypothetical protein